MATDPSDLTGAAKQFGKTHGFVTGIVLITIGVTGIYGSVTGNLANMLAALFDPYVLTAPGAKGSSGTNPIAPGGLLPSNIEGIIGSFANPVESILGGVLPIPFP